MNVKWIIEKDIWHVKEEAALINACKRQGFEYKIFSYIPFAQNENLKRVFSEKDCVISSGSIEFSSAIIKDTVYVPGTYSSYKSYLCSTYYNYFGDLLLNSEYVLLPFVEITRLKDMLFRKFGIENCIFIRPDSGKKLFKGKTVFQEKWDEEMEESKLWGVEGKDLVLISSPKNIEREWRFFAADKKVITGCMYKTSGFLTEDMVLNKKAHEFAQSCCEIYQPDRCFSIDVCQLEGGDMFLLELNSGTSSGFYECDIDKIVEAFSKCAWDDFLEYKKEIEL